MKKHRHHWIPSSNFHLLVCNKQKCKDLKPKNPGIFYSRLDLKFTHFCLDSPTGLCEYKEDVDFCWDECIYCHQPYERK